MAEPTALIALLACGLFTGAAIYINLVEHPARLECGPSLALAQFRPSYRRATITQVALASIATIACTARYLQGGSASWLLGASLIFAVMPFTVLVMFPTNRMLVEPGRDPESAETRALLVRWGRLHAVRSGLSLAAFLILIRTVLGS